MPHSVDRPGTLPGRARGRSRAIPASRSEYVVLAAAFLIPLTIELALVERKYAIFGGGFGVSRRLSDAADIALFALPVAGAQALFVGGLYLLFRRLFRHGEKRLLRRFSFLFCTISVMAALLAAKFQLLAYFSDAVSFTLLRSLGGGSLFDAFLFAASEGSVTLAAIAGALIAYGVAFVMLHGRIGAAAADPPALRGWHLLVMATMLPAGMLATNERPDSRYAAGRFLAYGLAEVVLDRATDVDGDGFGLFSAPVDRQPFDPARYPLALDIPGNGIDEDGLGGDFVDPGVTQAASPPVFPASPKHLIIVVLESTRGDALGRVFAKRPVMPNIDALAAAGTRVHEAYSHVGFTTASLKSLFSGELEPRAGGPSLFRDLKANGYRIGVFSGQPETFGDISEVVGMERNADVFVDADTLKAERAFSFAAKGSLLVDGKKLLREFDRHFGEAKGWAQPTFVYVNFQAAHFPYHYPGMPQILPGTPLPRGEISVANRERVAATYWNAVAYGDRLTGELIARLKRLGVWEDSLVMVTADHGESLFEDGFLGHGHVINRTQTEVPLVLSRPGLDVAGPVGLADYRSIILGALGAAPPKRAGGPVFQYIGSLDRPAVIGLVERGARWTTLDLETEEVRFSDLGLGRPYRDLPRGTAPRARADRLIREWERLRWRQRGAAN